MRFKTLILAIIWAGCQSPSEPERVTGGTDFGLYVQQTADSGYVLVGETDSFGAGQSDVWLIKTDPNGTVQWHRTYGGSLKDWGYTVAQTTDGGYIVIGSTYSIGAGDADIWLIKTVADGTLEWDRTFGSDNADLGYFVQQTLNGGFILAGETSSIGAGASDAYLILTDPSGDLLWEHPFGGQGIDIGYAVQQTLDEGFILTGLTDSLGVGLKDLLLIKTDPAGAVEWSRPYVYGNYATGRSVRQTPDGGFIVAGFYRSNLGNDIIWLVKVDGSGILEWDHTYAGPGNDRAASIWPTTDGGFAVTGISQSYGSGLNDAFLLKIDAVGTKQWNRFYGGKSWDTGRCIQQTFDGGYILTGTTQSFGGADPDAWLIKTDSAGTELWRRIFGDDSLTVYDE